MTDSIYSTFWIAVMLLKRSFIRVINQISEEELEESEGADNSLLPLIQKS